MCIKFYKCVNESTEQLYIGFIARSKSFSSCSLVKLLHSRPLKNSLKPYDDFTTTMYKVKNAISEPIVAVSTSKYIKNYLKHSKFARKLRKFFKNFFSKSKKSNCQICYQIQDRTTTSRDINEFQNHREKLSKIENHELPSGVVYFLTIFEHKFFLLNDHETDFSLVFHPLRARTTTPPIYSLLPVRGKKMF
jgi:hypothetical protein